GPPGDLMDLSAIHCHARFEDLLADRDVDLVDICTPTARHEAMATAALKAGKHVLVEKPIALETAAADRMLAAAKVAGKLLMVGQVLPFFPEFAYLADAVKTGLFGPFLGGQFKRVISRPDWSAAIGDAAQTGGPAIDLHIHDTHFIRLICGMPRQVVATGRFEGEAVTHLNALYLYGPGGPTVACASGALAQKGREFVHGFEAYFEKATLVFESGSQPLTLLPAGGGSERPTLGDGDPIAAFAAELKAAVGGVTAGKAPDLLSGELARDALVLCHRECESVKTGGPVDI
ncbi:MAG TPA: Gfo/Idh/MocA family oxidoreductase, partial [Gemmataceae bacterium]|nr:Gfo/Idh/MocA family oxidoreductase [Gemmataceae bacterium]